MIQILTVKELKDKQMICNKAAIDYTDDLHIIASFSDSGKAEQASIFRYKGTDGQLLWIDSGDDADLMDGIAKSVLSIMELRGVKTVTLPLWYPDLAKRLRFEKKEDCFQVNLEGYFCCNCQHN